MTVHRKSCPNISHEKRRLIDVFWKEDIVNSTYPVDLKIESEDRSNLIADIISIFNSKKIPVTSINGILHPQTSTTTVSVTIYVNNSSTLQDLMNVLKNVKSVYDVTRVNH